MARTFELHFSPGSFVPDGDAQLVAGDNPCGITAHEGRPALSYDDTDEEAAVSVETQMPNSYAAGTLKADIHFDTASDATNDVAFDVFVEAKTPGTDTLDMESAASWDSANSGTASVAGTTAGDPQVLTITLTNKDSVAAGDLFRIGLRRDTDSANDDVSGDVYVREVVVYEETA